MIITFPSDDAAAAVEEARIADDKRWQISVKEKAAQKKQSEKKNWANHLGQNNYILQ